MQTIATIGLDIAKSVFQVHGVDAAGQVVVRRQLKRRQVLAFFAKLAPCLIGIEACASSHYWARELQALGHTVRLIPPAYVKPYVKRQKNDAADAEAICEAVARPNMRFVPIKTPEQQGCLVLHRTRHLLVRQQTATINSIRAYLAEFGIVAPVGRRGVEQLLEVIADANDARVPEVARACVVTLGVQLRQLKAQILELDRRILAWHRSHTSRVISGDQRLLTVSKRTLDQRGSLWQMPCPRSGIGSNPLDDTSPAADRLSDPNDSDPLPASHLRQANRGPHVRLTTCGALPPTEERNLSS
jgi:transposase